MIDIQLFDKQTLDKIQWPDTEEAMQAQAIFVPMLEEGVEAYIENVATDLYLLKIEEHIIPITVNEREYKNSYLTSNYYPIKYLEEHLPTKFPRLYFLQRPVLQAMGFMLKMIKINKVVVVNNWLLTTNVYPKLTHEQIKALTSFLKKRFPDHMLTFRSLDQCRCSELTSELRASRYRLIGSRFIFSYDPAEKKHFSSKVRYHHRRDRRLIESEGYEVIRGDEMQPGEKEQALKLYNHTYVSRHTKYSPQYTKRFVERASKSRFLDLIGLKKGGEMQGVIGYYQRNQTLTVPFFGFDGRKGQANHIYRILTMLVIDEAEKRDVVLNDGSGGGSPKRHRGMRPFPEYVAFYDRHLPLYRRVFWAVAEFVVSKITFPRTLKKMNLD